MRKNKRRKKRLRAVLILLIILFILAGLGGMLYVSHRDKVEKEQRREAALAALDSIPEVTATPAATATPVPTATPTPSLTPVPTILPAFEPENYQGIWYSEDGLTTIDIYDISLKSVSFTYKRVNGKDPSMTAEADVTAEVAGNATQFRFKDSDELITMAKDINDKPPKREMDMLFTIGEQMSVALMSMAMNSLGVPAVSLNAFQVAMHTTSAHGSARLKKIDAARIRRELDNRRIVVVTGFQGIDKYNDYTTLGRGGSDTTAVALAAALHADACEIYTDVDGVYTADPRKVPNARKLKEITYDEMLDLATLGAGVLHNRSVEMAKKYGVPLVVRSSLNNSEGTVVKEEVTVERMLISGVALDTDAVRIAVIGLKDSPGVAFKLFDTLAKKNINVDMILQSIGRAGTKDISFTVDKNDLDDAMGVLEANQARIAYSELHAEKNIAKLSIVGAGMMSNPGVAAKMFESLYNEGVNINMIATSEIRVTVLINEKDGVCAMNAVHDAFNLAD